MSDRPHPRPHMVNSQSNPADRHLNGKIEDVTSDMDYDKGHRHGNDKNKTNPNPSVVKKALGMKETNDESRRNRRKNQ